ncbi:MAG TPA: hypothetical protein PLD93_04960, partial [Synergistaceae bacterium]|nr:hypothetical protein [Synergistaceae bacterium]
MLTTVFAAGTLTVKYKLEELRARVQEKVESRTGTRLDVGSVLVNGLRGLRLEDVQIILETDTGPRAVISVPVALMYIDIVDLIYGKFTIERLQMDGAEIRLERASGGKWFVPEALEVREVSRLLSFPSFRIIGHDGSLELVNVVGNTRLMLTDFSFDVSKLEGSPRIFSDISGNVNGNEEGRLDLSLNFVSFEDFELRAQSDYVSAKDINIFLPADQQLIASGSGSPQFRAMGTPGPNIMLYLEVPFNDFSIRNQPGFLEPATGTLTA